MAAVNLQLYIHKLELDEQSVLKRAPMVEAERASAIRDLLRENMFHIHDHPKGPYYIRIGIDGHRLILKARDCMRNELPEIVVSLSPFRRLIKDYFLICESYQMAHASGDPTRLETIDMARRGIHNEGAEILRTRLKASVETDFETARCLFTLICVLHIGKLQPW